MDICKLKLRGLFIYSKFVMILEGCGCYTLLVGSLKFINDLGGCNYMDAFTCCASVMQTIIGPIHGYICRDWNPLML